MKTSNRTKIIPYKLVKCKKIMEIIIRNFKPGKSYTLENRFIYSKAVSRHVLRHKPKQKFSDWCRSMAVLSILVRHSRRVRFKGLGKSHL